MESGHLSFLAHVCMLTQGFSILSTIEFSRWLQTRDIWPTCIEEKKLYRKRIQSLATNLLNLFSSVTHLVRMCVHVYLRFSWSMKRIIKYTNVKLLLVKLIVATCQQTSILTPQ